MEPVGFCNREHFVLICRSSVLLHASGYSAMWTCCNADGDVLITCISLLQRLVVFRAVDQQHDHQNFDSYECGYWWVGIDQFPFWSVRAASTHPNFFLDSARTNEKPFGMRLRNWQSAWSAVASSAAKRRNKRAEWSERFWMHQGMQLSRMSSY